MAQSKQQIQAILSSIGAQPRHRFGQNFMIDQNLVRLIADAGEVTDNDSIIEVGPGTGTLTEELLSRNPGKLIAAEIDRDLAANLRQRFGGDERFELIEGDALKGKHEIDPVLMDRIAASQRAGRAVKLVANLPYNIASPLVIELLIAGVGLLAFTVQKEVADRLKAPAGSDDYGPLSVMAQLLGRVEVLRTLPPQAFWPAPKVDSALVRILPLPRGERAGVRGEISTGQTARDSQDRGLPPHPNPLPSGERGLSRFIHAVFSYRRKTLRKALEQAGYDSAPILNATNLDGGRRPEEFSPAEFLLMFRSSAAPPGGGRS